MEQLSGKMAEENTTDNTNIENNAMIKATNRETSQSGCKRMKKYKEGNRKRKGERERENKK